MLGAQEHRRKLAQSASGRAVFSGCVWGGCPLCGSLGEAEDGDLTDTRTSLGKLAGASVRT